MAHAQHSVAECHFILYPSRGRRWPQHLGGRRLASPEALVAALRLTLELTALQGEDQKKLDIIANEVFKNVLKRSGQCAVLVSERRSGGAASEGARAGSIRGGQGAGSNRRTMWPAHAPRYPALPCPWPTTDPGDRGEDGPPIGMSFSVLPTPPHHCNPTTPSCR